MREPQQHATSARYADPDFGPNVKIFAPDIPVDEINAYLLSISDESEFGDGRHAVFFRPGIYGEASGQDDPAHAAGILNATVGYYTAIAGLGQSPDDVLINGALHVDPGDTLTNFFRSLSNIAINPIQRPVGVDAASESPHGVADPHTMTWAVSQATPLRRVHIKGSLDLTGKVPSNAFGSTLINSRIDGAVISGDATLGPAQAQWYTRDSWIGAWNGVGVNTVFSGVEGAPPSNFVGDGTTTLAHTPTSREAPFLFIDEDDAYKVFVPHVKHMSSGTHWSTGPQDGTALPLDAFFIAHPEHSAADINMALATGKNLILTPGLYSLEAPIVVDRDGTIILGLGFATLVPAPGISAFTVGDVNGVIISAVTVDAGPNTDILIRIGESGNTRLLEFDAPTSLSDVFVRVGGRTNGQVRVALEINSDNVILDDCWIWRADHGAGAGWTSNLAEYGLVVNGCNVTATGLMVEHFQKNQVVWNGELGTTVYYQSEFPYDVPAQVEWMDGESSGHPSYVVAPGVKSHQGTGLAIYGLFFAGLSRPTPSHIRVSAAVTAPVAEHVRFTALSSAIIVAGAIDHVINTTGQSVDATSPNSLVPGMTAVTRLASG
ncbi:adenylyl cyclase [Microbacterium sp. P5_E9]